ncbi:MmgE/PrpD family protein [Bordetella sp. N]|uniref:MmgE/PrpD family protein n=1 Tax=Bordetella sp. N TaxID=1746199 RepID=UPI00070AF1FE|nr:MmgE/PrpD family protein [Bordetella sp. N]ALM82327.1 hypothetical protein ASB57_04535 [Bordetella sp. N]
MGNTDSGGFFAAALAELALKTYRGSYSELAARNATNCIADTISVALAGCSEPCVAILADTPGVCEAPGDGLIWGAAQRTSALDAALINATASHALDYDDICAKFGGHHSAPLVAPLLAVGEGRKSSGEEILRAYITGVEVEVRLASALHPEHYGKGWHPTSTIGVFGVAAAAACLLGLDETQLATALGLCASMASGIKANFGSMAKPLHVGMCARSGLLAALLAQRGYDAGPQAFEGVQGFFNVYNGAGNYALERVFEAGDGGLEIEGTSVGIKQFPCCGSTHAAITMALEVLRDIQRDANPDARRQSGLDPSQVKQIRILPNGNRLAHTNKPMPRTVLEAKFSVQHVVARALVSGSVRLDHFSEACVQDPAILELLHKTEALPHPDMPLTGDHLWGAEVIVHLHSGAVFSRRIEDLTCRDGNYPMSDEELWEKFKDCAGARLAPVAVKQLYERLHNLKAIEDVGSVTALLSVHD